MLGCASKYLKIVHRFFQLEVQLASIKNFRPLHEAAHLHLVNSVFALSFNQRTPLHMAAEGGYIEIVRYLVDEKRADINVENKLGVRN